jgi:exopolysaccharide biosynthesis protein
MFGSLPGFRFDFSYTLESGLENEGTVIGANKDGMLYLIIYTGTRFYYYGKHKRDVERLIDSIRIL